MTHDLHTLSITGAQRLLVSRALSPLDLVKTFLERIVAVDGIIVSVAAWPFFQGGCWVWLVCLRQGASS